MSLRPAFLDQHSWWTVTRRESLSRADYASPVTRYVSNDRAWRICERFAAGLLVGVLLCIALGVI